VNETKLNLSLKECEYFYKRIFATGATTATTDAGGKRLLAFLKNRLLRLVVQKFFLTHTLFL